MNPLLTRIIGHVVQRVANDPVARRQVAGAAKKVAKEAKTIGVAEDPARAAGRAVQRTLNRLQRRDG